MEQNGTYGIGREDGFSEFYRNYFRMIFRYVHRRVRDVQTAEDIVQETFCAAYVKRLEVLAHPEPQRWLKRTAKYKMLELYRRMKYRSTVPLEEGMGLGREEPCYSISELELTASAVLSTEEWKLVKAYYLYGISITELAAAEGISVNNMRVRLFRMKEKLKK